MTRQLSSAGRTLIKSYETGATPAGRLLPPGEPALEAYLCPAGVWTIGWGHTGPEVIKGYKISRIQAEQLFDSDIAIFEAGVNRMLGDAPTTQGQFDALVSFAFNVGLDDDADTIPEGLGDSTLLKRHLAGQYDAAAAQFALWNKARRNGKLVAMAGLTRRRSDEVALYRTPDPQPMLPIALTPLQEGCQICDANDARCRPEPPKSLGMSTTIASALGIGIPAAPVTVESVQVVKDSIDSTKAEADKVGNLAWASSVLGIVGFAIAAFLIWKRFKERREGLK